MIDKVDMFPLALLLLVIHCASAGRDYLAVLAYKSSSTSVTAKAGETGGLVELQYPQFGYRTPHALASYRSASINIHGKMKVMGSIEPKVIIISTSDDDMQITLKGESRFNPLPISVLGTKYIVPSDMTYTEDYEKLLVVATHNQSTDVDISFRIKEGAEYINGHIFRSGERITLGLRPYQTLTIITKNDINGTVISARDSIAVYTGIIYNNTHTAYDQLLPVKHYGQEFVVAVETTGRNSQLQVITEQNDTQIRFSSGAEFSLGEKRFYQRPLYRNLHISATRPVMVTVIRRDGVKSVFATVPPVNTYMPANYTLAYAREGRPRQKICTRKTASLVLENQYIHQWVTVDWEEISGSGYKVGTVSWYVWYGYSTHLSFDHPFTLLTYHNGSNAYHYYLYSVSLEEAPARPFRGRTYLMALPRFRPNHNLPYLPGIHASTGGEGGQWQIQNPYTGKIWSRQVPPFNTDYFYPQYSINTANGIQNKTILVHVEDDDIQIGGHANTTVFSPLPISALGTKYILSFCHPSRGHISIIVIATHSKKTNVDITFSLGGYITYDNKLYFHGDTLSLTLLEYQAFTLNSTSDLTGTVVASGETIAVYSATYEGFYSYRGLKFTKTAASIRFIAYQQLLPKRHHGKEYVVAVREQLNSSPPYQLQVVTDHSDTQIMFNDGSTVSVGDTGVFRKRYGPRTNLSFNTTQPVMTMLCLLSYDRYGTFTIVPPVACYTKQSAITIGGTLQIITDKGNNNVHVEGHFTSHEYNNPYTSKEYNNHDTSVEFNIHVDWTPIQGSRYKVGTCTATDYFMRYLMTDFFVFVHSNTPFSILTYRPVSTYKRRLFHLVVDNGGFSFKSYQLNNETKDISATKPKNNGTTPFQGSHCNDNAVVIVGVCCGLVIVSLVIGFTGYVLYVRRKMKSSEDYSSVNASVSQVRTTFV